MTVDQIIARNIRKARYQWEMTQPDYFSRLIDRYPVINAYLARH